MPVKLKTSAGGSVSLQGHASQSSDTTLTFPNGTGSNTQALTTDGSGNLSWEAAGGGGVGESLIDNGAMQVYQRASSVSSIDTSSGAGGVHVSDRWYSVLNYCGYWTISNEADAPTGFSRSQKYTCTSAFGSLPSNAQLRFMQKFEGQDLQHLKYGTSDAVSLTLSFWVKSNKPGTYVVDWQNTDNSRIAAGTYSVSSSGTWEKKTITISGDTANGFTNDNNHSLYLSWWLSAGSDFTGGTQASSWEAQNNANRAVSQAVDLSDATSNYWQVTGVKLEVGATATDYVHKKFSDELQRCQRYYEKSYNMDTYAGASTYDGMRQAGNMDSNSGNYSQRLSVDYAVRKRANPTITCYDSSGNSGKVNMPDTTTNVTPTLVVNQESTFAIEASVTGTTDHRLYTHFVSDAEL